MNCEEQDMPVLLNAGLEWPATIVGRECDSPGSSRADRESARQSHNGSRTATGAGSACTISASSPRHLISSQAFPLRKWYALWRHHELIPFLEAIGLFLMSFVGIAISLWPMIFPFHCTLWQAASHALRHLSENHNVHNQAN
jgi:hypothetical protein